ncbi:ImmA/IrrE family metallo-endopeptidase [Salinicoccus hispanicus]|uniref:ImmA/IrrE family metallo-endopeptidase n=1 Tax=Salinicoccus hispanicus TaxID=157225 RepID=A0A6N8U2Q9_9STAP|nr:ImmA/IrrE family metallo-endopeptidase [Salinicoccus hispanicus]MXQ52013.1 ImmA/IrrE family metallo-endopeptidase [Salinicoccus hispanicus]
MAKVEMKVNPAVIRHYVDQSRYDVEFLKTQNTLSNIEKWLDGTRQPTLRQLENLGKKLSIPLGYLVLDEPIDDTPPILDYRTVDSLENNKGSRELIDTIKFAQQQQEFVSEYRRNNGFEALRYVEYFNLESPVETIVEFSRSLFDIDAHWQRGLNGKEPFKYFREKLSQLGILVLVNGIVGQNTHRTLDIEEFRAFVIIDRYAPAIFINTNDSRNGQVFSMLHEFAHILFGENEVYNASVKLHGTPSPMEQKCNQFASEILMPNHVFLEQWEAVNDKDPLETATELAKTFKVSSTVTARKALDNGLIKEEIFNSIAEKNHEGFKQGKNKAKESNSGGHYWNNLNYKLDPVVYKTVRNSFYEGDLQFTQALKLLNISARAFHKLDNQNDLD